MSCRPPLTLADFGVFDVAKIHIFPDITRKRNPRQHKLAGNRAKRWVLSKLCKCYAQLCLKWLFLYHFWRKNSVNDDHIRFYMGKHIPTVYYEIPCGKLLDGNTGCQHIDSGDIGQQRLRANWPRLSLHQYNDLPLLSTWPLLEIHTVRPYRAPPCDVF